jgi:hypothetical protein
MRVGELAPAYRHLLGAGGAYVSTTSQMFGLRRSRGPERRNLSWQALKARTIGVSSSAMSSLRRPLHSTR